MTEMEVANPDGFRNIGISLLPPQHEFITSEARQILYSGAFGAGKTRGLCYKIAMRACEPGAREGLCRKHLTSLKATTLKTLLEPEADLPAVLPLGTYTHNKNEHLIKIIGGGEIIYFGVDDEKKIGSYNLSGCAIDEAVELDDDEWIMLNGRCRLLHPTLKNQIYGACNPGPPAHFLAEKFGLMEGYDALPPEQGCFAVRTSSLDNHYLPDDYIESLQNYKGVAYARYVEGRWVGSEGLIYDMFDRRVFVKENEGPWVRVIVGQDEGYRNAAVMLVICEDVHGNLHVKKEWSERGKLEGEVVEEAHRINYHFHPESFEVDPSAAKLRAAMREEGLPANKADNDLIGGIQLVRNRLVKGEDGPKLTIDPSCRALIRGLESYSGKEDDPEKPIKENDDECDSLRYGVAAFDGAKRFGLIIPEYDPRVHKVEPFEIPEDWPKWRFLNPSLSMPVACGWATVAPVGWNGEENEVLLVYREYYDGSKTIEDHARAIRRLSAGEVYARPTLISPKAYRRDKSNNVSLAQQFREARLPVQAWPSVQTPGEQAMIEKTRTLFGEGRVMIFRDCQMIDRELRLWRYKTDGDGKPLPSGQFEQEHNRLIAGLVAWANTRPVHRISKPVILDGTAHTYDEVDEAEAELQRWIKERPKRLEPLLIS